jgi:hypothetical protein
MLQQIEPGDEKDPNAATKPLSATDKTAFWNAYKTQWGAKIKAEDFRTPHNLKQIRYLAFRVTLRHQRRTTQYLTKTSVGSSRRQEETKKKAQTSPAERQ